MSAENRLENMFPLWKPKFWLTNEEKDSRAVRDAYAFYGHVIAREIRKKEKDFPRDIVIVGANWFQVIEDTSRPKIKFIGQNIEDRLVSEEPIDQIDAILERITNGIHGHIFTPRMIKKFAILDVAGTGYPLYSEEEVKSKKTVVIENRNWGQMIKRLGFPAFVYHITHNYKHLNAESALWYKDDFVDGRPVSWLNSFDGIKVKEKIGTFASRIINQIRQEEGKVPLGTLIIGDNWRQTFMGRTKPKNDHEARILKEHKTALFGETWPPEPREENEDFLKLFAVLFDDVLKGRIEGDLSEITIIDRTTVGSTAPILGSDEYTILSEEKWGKILLVERFKTVVYYVDRAVWFDREQQEKLIADHFN